LSDNLSGYIGKEVCLTNSRGARFKGILKATLLNGNAVLWCHATDVGYGWIEYKAELKVVVGARIEREMSC